MNSSTFRHICLGLSLFGVSSLAATETLIAAAPLDHDGLAPEPAVPTQARWALGLTLSNSPSYAGAVKREWGVRPILSGQLGRWTLSTSSAKRMTSSGTAGTGGGLTGGLSTSIFGTDRFDVGMGLRVTNGRRSTDDSRLSGLPDIDPSAAIRASLRYQLHPQWQINAGLQQDLFERQGLKAHVGLGWSQRLWNGWELDLNSGVGWADTRAMRTYYGIPVSAATAQRPAWMPNSGMETWFVGVGLSRPIGKHWRVAGSLGHSSLIGQAAQSPLTQKRDAAVASFSIAYVGW
jgi:outer membrane scaffolding protein for murein synthesis (MipA/OmpV family)